MNHVSLVFSLLQSASINDAASRAIGFQRARQGCGCRYSHDCLQHLDDVVDRVFLVIKNNDVIDLFLCGCCGAGDLGVGDNPSRHVNSLVEIGCGGIEMSYHLLP